MPHSAVVFLEPLNKADRRPAVPAMRRKGNTASHRSVSRPSRLLSQSRPEATCSNLLVSSLCSDCEEKKSCLIASSAKSGRNKCGKSVCNADLSAWMIASRTRASSPGKRHSYCACNRHLSARSGPPPSGRNTHQNNREQPESSSPKFHSSLFSRLYLTSRLCLAGEIVMPLVRFGWLQEGPARRGKGPAGVRDCFGCGLG